MQMYVDGVLVDMPEEDASTLPSAGMVPVPASISRRQFLLALLGAGFITPSEAISAATAGALPAAVSALFSALPPTEATGAIITWASMTMAERNDPLILMLIDAGIASAADVDNLFRVGATL